MTCHTKEVDELATQPNELTDVAGKAQFLAFSEFIYKEEIAAFIL